MKPEFNNQQSDWLNQTEELNDLEAAQVNGGSAPVNAASAPGNGGSTAAADQRELAARTRSIQQQAVELQIAFQQQTAGPKAAKAHTISPK